MGHSILSQGNEACSRSRHRTQAVMRVGEAKTCDNASNPDCGPQQETTPERQARPIAEEPAP